MNMAVKLNSKKMRMKVEEALQRYDEDVSADKDERGLSMDDFIFAFSEDGQWDDLAKKRRRNKPRYTVNQVAAAVNEVVGNYKQNRIEIKARPERDADKDETDAFNGLIRATVNTHDAKLAKDTAFKGIATGGFAAFRVLNKYAYQNPFEQDVCIEPIWEAMETVWFDCRAKHPTGKDGSHVFEEETITREEFERRWPEASLKPWPDQNIAKLQRSWGLSTSPTSKSDVKIVDYYVKEPKKSTKVLLSDGSMMDAVDYEATADELAAKDIQFVMARDVESFKVMHYKMSGGEVLEQPVEIPSQYLPIIRCLGYYEWMDGTLHYRGIVRASKDPQRVYNYATSASIEATALKPKDKVMATPKMVQGHEQSWRSLNNSETPLLLYTPDPSAPDGKPAPYVSGQGTPELVQQAQQSQLDIQATIGRRSPAQGETPSDRSGRAILALQKQDDAVTFELLDNLAISWEHAAQVVIDMIPRVIDTERQIMILGDDNEELIATFNETITDDQTGQEYRKNDTSRRYRVKASVGPAFETKRTEAVNVLSTIGQDERYGAMVPDLLAKSLDFPFSEELSKRFRKVMLQQGIVDPTEEEIEEQQRQAQTPEGQAQMQQQQAMMQLQMQNAQLDLALKQAQVENLTANIANLQAATMEKMNKSAKDNADIEETRVDVYSKQVNSVIDMINAGLQPTPAQLSTIEQSLALLDATQRQEFERRISEALGKAQQIQQQV